LKVTLLANHFIASYNPTAKRATVTNSITSAESTLACDAIVMVTDRIPNDALYHELLPALTDGTLKSLRVIGDAEAPNIIAQAVFSGHLAAREFDEQVDPDGTPFKVERYLVISGASPDKRMFFINQKNHPLVPQLSHSQSW
jgi:dimethylamine/trimethylamine dehydrogenase